MQFDQSASYKVLKVNLRNPLQSYFLLVMG